jgi:phosphoserine aminotransferase
MKIFMMKNRVYNFGAGPAMLPESILLEAQDELLDWNNSGMSVMEIGHRTSEFTALLEHAEKSLRQLLSIPKHYQVLFLGGAARTQFAMIPMNLLHPNEQAAYLVTGIWSQMAYAEVLRLKKAYCVASGESSNFSAIPDFESWDIKKESTYLYYTPNETVNGIRVPFIPEMGEVPLIADMTSCLLSEPIDIERYGLIFAGAQKNIANAGLTLVIIRDDLLARTPKPIVATMMDYQIQTENHSMYATPPVFNCYLAAKMFDWIQKQGGVQVLYERNCAKAQLLYQFLDVSYFYTTPVVPEARSIINVCFSIKNKALEQKFITLAREKGLAALQGHRTIGGLRASLYNAMPIAGVEALVDFMAEFAQDNPL